MTIFAFEKLLAVSFCDMCCAQHKYKVYFLDGKASVSFYQVLFVKTPSELFVSVLRLMSCDVLHFQGLSSFQPFPLSPPCFFILKNLGLCFCVQRFIPCIFFRSVSRVGCFFLNWYSPLLCRKCYKTCILFLFLVVCASKNGYRGGTTPPLCDHYTRVCSLSRVLFQCLRLRDVALSTSPCHRCAQSVLCINKCASNFIRHLLRPLQKADRTLSTS